jgi:hypothetical protein
MIRSFVLTGFVLLSLNPFQSVRRADMLHIRVSAAHATPVRVIWYPRAGVIGASVDDQQRRLQNPLRVQPPADSLRRWHDPLARDTVRASTPVELVVDMTQGPVRVEVVGIDSVEVEAQLAPARGPLVRARGRTFVVEADGRTPILEPRL